MDISREFSQVPPTGRTSAPRFARSLGLCLLFVVSIAASPRAQDVDLYFSELETAGDQAEWMLSGDWRFKSNTACIQPLLGYYSPTNALVFSFSSECAYRNNRIGFATLTRDIDIPITYPAVTLEWWDYVGAETGADFYSVQISTDAGQSWTEIFKDSVDETFWDNEQVDLTPYIGQTIRVRFGFITDATVTNDGWYIDNVRIFGETLASGVSALALEGAEVQESDGGTVPMNFTVLVDPPNQSPITLEHITIGGTAAAGIDFAATSGPLVIPINSTTYTIPVPVLGDSFFEPAESFTLVISNPSENAVITLGEAQGTILDDDELTCVFEENFETPAGSFPWSVGFLPNQPAEDPNCANPLDPLCALQLWHIQQVSTCITPAEGSGFRSPSRALVFNSEATCAYDTPGGVTGIVEMTSPVELPDVEALSAQLSFEHFLEIAFDAIQPDITSACVEISTDARVNWATLACFGPTTPSDEFFRIDWQQETISLDPYLGEDIFIRFVFDQPNEVNPNTARGWYIDDMKICYAPRPSDVSKIVLKPASTTEGSSGSKNLLFDLDIVPDNAAPISLDYRTGEFDGPDAATPDVDFTSINGTKTIAPNQTTTTIPIVLIGDDQPEPLEEKFTLTISGVSPNVFLVNSEAIGTILDDDAPSTIDVGLVGTDPLVKDVDENAGTVTFEAVLSQARTVPISVDYTTQNGTALGGAGLDFTPASGTITFPPNIRRRTFTVTILNDNQLDPNESFNIVFSTNSPYAAGGSVPINIIDDETGPPVGAVDLNIGDISVTEGSCATISAVTPCATIYQATFTVSLSGAGSPADVTISYMTVDETATAGDDYEPVQGTLTIPAFTTTATVSVDIWADRKVEGGSLHEETFSMVLTNPVGNVNVVSNTGVCTIRDDDYLATALGVNGSDIVLRDLDQDTPTTAPLIGTPLNLAAAEFRGFEFDKLFGWVDDKLVNISLVTGNFIQVADHSALTIGDISGLTWDHTNGDAIAVSTSGEIFSVNLNDGTASAPQNLANRKWMAIASHPTSARLYALARNGGAVELYVLYRGATWAAQLVGTLSGFVPGDVLQDIHWACDFNDTTGELIANVLVDGGANPDVWETRIVQLNVGSTPGQVDTKAQLVAPTVTSIAVATPPPPSSVLWTSDLPFAATQPDGAEFTADPAENVVAGIGEVLSGLGDINGDTFEDFALAAPQNAANDGALAGAGQVFILFGGPKTGAAELLAQYLEDELVFGPDTFTGTNGLLLEGSIAAEAVGTAVTGAGDMNGDGIAEFAVAYTGSNGAGGVYLVLGNRSFPALIRTNQIGSLSFGATVPGVKINGADANDQAGASVSGAGDFNNDGWNDLLIGAPFAGPGAGAGAGAGYIVFGSNQGIGTNGVINLQSLAPPRGIQIIGEATGDGLGTSVTGAGDLNGDGIEDVAFGAPTSLSLDGSVIVVFGHPDYGKAGGPTVLNLARLSDGNSGAGIPNSFYFTVQMPAPGDLMTYINPPFQTPPFTPGDLGVLPGMRLRGELDSGLGTAIAGAGDVNGDSIDDIVLGAPNYDGSAQPEPHTGRAYLLLGASGSDHAPESLATNIGTSVPGVRLIPDDDVVGNAVAGAGDINGDGLLDLLIGAGSATPGGFSGEAYIVYGAQGLAGTLSLRDLANADPAAARGRYLYNTATGSKTGFGVAVALAGDADNDTISDILVGRSGGAYLITGEQITDNAKYMNRMRSGASELPSPGTGGGIDLGENVRRAMGGTGDGRHSQPISRASITFKGGGVGSELADASTQSVTIFRKAAPDVPVGSGAADDDKWIPAGVHWLVQTDRQGFTQSSLEFYYRPEEIAGLDSEKMGVFYAKPGQPLSDQTTWSWLPYIHDPDRRVFTVARTHSSDPQGELNGYYALIQADLLTELGGVIPAVGVTPDNLFATGPNVTPADKTYWHTRDKKLYAVGEGEVTIQWKNFNGETVSEVRAVNLWPAPESGKYQDYIAASPEVDLNQSGPLKFEWGQITEYDATFVNQSAVNSTDVMTDRLFKGTLTANNNPVLSSPEDPATTARVLVQLSTKPQPDQGDIYFQFLRVVKWNNPTVTKGGADGVNWPVGLYIAGATSPQYAQFHDEAAGSPFVLFANAPYAPSSSRYPGFYDRTSRTGTVVPVNVKRPGESDLVLSFYQLGAKLIDARTGNPVRDPGTLQPIPTFGWPYATTKYNLSWQTIPDKIVIARQDGSGQLDITQYGDDFDVYVQNNPALPGFNPNEEHALLAPYQAGRALFALRNDLNDFADPTSSDYTSAPYALLVYNDPNDSLPDGTRRTKTKPFQVVAEEGIYQFQPWPNVPAAQDPYEGEAGSFINPPYPLSIFAYSEDNDFQQASSPYVFEDRTARHWAKSATGTINSLGMLFYYPVQDDFYFPAKYLAKYPDLDFVVGGSDVPFLDGGPSVSTTTPKPVKYQTAWPADIPRMKLGEILMEAKFGLPQINGQCSVDLIYQQNSNIVKLIDPTFTREVPLEELPLDIAQAFRNGEVSFPLLPPKLDFRVSYDSLNKKLKFKGVLVDPVTGFDYVLINVMTEEERDIIKGLSADGTNSSSDWAKAVTALYTASQSTYDIPNSTTTPYNVLALTTGDAQNTGYITLAMQNAGQCSPLPVSLEILLVEPDANVGEIAIVKPACVFDEKLTLTSTLDFGGNPDNFTFEWMYLPDEGGTLPEPPNPSDPTDPWAIPPIADATSGVGINEITIEGPNLVTLTDNWFAMRYKRVGSNPAPWPTTFSDWTPVQLAPGWIKRVVGEINPFTQRASGGGIEGAEASFATFAANAPNTIVSMISQAGPRFAGSVPLNCDNLDGFGLIPIYETVLNRGATLSIDSLSPIDNPQVNTALLLAASRIADLYALLGNEAYADAQDPTIGFGTDDGQFGAEATSIHPFMNQTATLLEEEIGLLRGRWGRLPLGPLPPNDVPAPSVMTDPIYNRFIWNFTTALTGGEVAYALNYNILDEVQGGDGVISEADAKRLYPQGHGDAWGHYLTAMTRYYRLLNHPFYTWVPRSEAVLVGGAPVTVDFLDERKFATIAAAKARTGAEIVNLAYRDAYVENPESQWQGFIDDDPYRAWGFTEWASRAGQGAYIDWAVGNAIVRSVDPDPAHEGVTKIDRTTVYELSEIADRFAEIQAKNDEADIGLNPLGLGTNVIPFDIDPAQIDEGETHFEQVWSRAVTAVNNAKAAFDNANGATQLLRSQNDSIQNFERAALDTELDFKARLIEIFGYPYADDIGPGGLYASGYDGPDLFHYMISEESGIQRDNLLKSSPYNQSSTGDTANDIPSLAEVQVANFMAQPEYNIGTGELVFQVLMKNYGAVAGCDFTTNTDGTVGAGCVTLPAAGPLVETPLLVKYNMKVDDNYFGISKPAAWTGQRRAPGEIQNARSELIQAAAAFIIAVDDYGGLVGQIDDQVKKIRAQYNLSAANLTLLRNRRSARSTVQDQILALKSAQFGLNTAATIVDKLSDSLKESIPTVTGIIVGFSNGVIIDGLAPVRGGFGAAGTAIVEGLKIIANGLDLGVLIREQQGALADDDLTINTAALEGQFANLDAILELQNLLRSEVPTRTAAHTAHESVVQAIGNYQRVLADGMRSIDRRDIFRKQTSADVQQFRYKDMAFRIFRNDALQKYRAQFDLAARYTYLAAKAYDYETTMLNSDPMAGQRFLTDIVKARQLGALTDGIPQTGQGLSNSLAVMARNFEVLKGQLGFNNPQVETSRFSLRHELFRVLPTEQNPANTAWRNLLRQDYSANGVGTAANLWDVPEFKQFCVPPDGFTSVEPGIVIPFSTTIEEGKNFFGRSDYGALDSSYDSTQFATKIRSVGLWFSNYDVLGLSNTPRVWLIPAGIDTLRSPSSVSGARRNFNVLEQILPVPFPIGHNDLESPNWIPSVDSLSTPIIPTRRFGRFRAYHDSGEFTVDEVNRDSRLIGRSVWNTRWMLIIPASTLSNDRAEGLARFIDGRLVNGVRNGNGVSDIKLFFETYAFPRLKSNKAQQDGEDADVTAEVTVVDTTATSGSN